LSQRIAHSPLFVQQVKISVIFDAVVTLLAIHSQLKETLGASAVTYRFFLSELWQDVFVSLKLISFIQSYATAASLNSVSGLLVSLLDIHVHATSSFAN